MHGRFAVHRGGATALSLAALLTLALLLAGASTLTPKAEAAFTTTKCAGSNILGRGASFARDAHGLFNNYFRSTFCAGTSGLGTINVTYDAAGSGAGRSSVKSRVDTPRFGMTDEPPDPTEVQRINRGVAGTADPTTDTNANDNGRIHVVPAAVGAVAPLVNFPNGCDQSLLPALNRTDEKDFDSNGVPDGVVRVRFTKDQYERAWAQGGGGDAPLANWDDIFPELAADADCAKPVIRVVRFDDSGTTFAFKDFLNTIEPTRGWLTTYAPANNNREWPGATIGPRTDCNAGTPPNGPGSAADTIDHLTSGCANGNGSLVEKLIVTDGSIGYSDISTARNASSSLAITRRTTNASAFDNDTYWTQLQNGSDQFAEPTAFEDGVLTNGTTGANCGQANFANAPTTTLEADWTPVSGVNSTQGYPICTLTYGLVFDDNSLVWGGADVEEQKARTVKDYWTALLETPAQNNLFLRDYAPLPAGILATARAGIAAVDWNKAGGSSTPPPGGSTPPPGGGTPPPGGGGDTCSNAFSVVRTTVSSKTGGATVKVRLPGAGKMILLAQAKNKGKNIRVRRLVLTASRSGTFGLTFKPSAAAKALLRKQGSLRVTVKLTYSPTGNCSARTRNQQVTLKLRSQKS